MTAPLACGPVPPVAEVSRPGPPPLRGALLAASALLLTACASHLPPGDKAAVAPPSPAKATVYVIDAVRGFRLGTGELVVVNGTTVAPLSGRQYTWFQVDPGVVDISMHNPSIRDRKMSARRLVVEPGRTYFIAYRRAGYEGSETLFYELLLGRKQGPEVWPEDMPLVSEGEARRLMATRKLVGCRDPRPGPPPSE